MKLRWILLVLAIAVTGYSQEKPQPPDGAHRPFHDSLLDQLAGKWKISGTTLGKPAELNLEADWVLNHQFLRIHEAATNAPPGRAPYEAMVFIGYDNASERYVAHWIDIFGGRFSETLGLGRRDGDAIRFVFEYPDGPFHNSFIWEPQKQQWHFLLEQKDDTGKWTNFADQVATQIAGPK